MADYDRDDEAQDDVLDLTEADQAPDDTEQQDDDEQGSEDEQIVFEVDGAPVESGTVADNGLVKHLRQQIKDQAARLKQYERPQQPVEVGPKPTLAGCEYDEEAYERELDAWRDRKTEADKAGQQQREAEEANQKRFQDEHAAYQAKKQALGFADMPQAEAAVADALTDWQQNAIIRYAGDPAKVIYALGKSSGKRDELASLTDPIAFAIAVSKLEGNITVSKRPKPPAPEDIARGTARSPGVDKEEARLEKEADRTGDRTALINYRRSKR